jgi:pyruvate/2-oxoglutarate dehydrogenase complex dihydrolipoamide acyltransferase (E2) component
MPRADAQTLSEDLTAIVASAADPKKVSSEVFGVPRELIGSNLIGVQTPALDSSIKHDIEIRVPDIGDFSDVQVIELLVKVGDKINAEQSLITVESDKACLEIPSLHSGILKDLKVKLGDKVSEGALIATIETVDIVEVSESQLQQSNSSNAPDVLEVRIPDIGDIKDVVVIEVLVKVGDIVQKEQSLITIESDKCTMEIPSSQSGVVKEVKVRLGDKVNQGLLVLLLEAPVSTKSSLANEAQCPAVKVFIPSTRQLSRLTLVTEILELMDGVRSRSKYWHI